MAAMMMRPDRAILKRQEQDLKLRSRRVSVQGSLTGFGIYKESIPVAGRILLGCVKEFQSFIVGICLEYGY